MDKRKLKLYILIAIAMVMLFFSIALFSNSVTQNKASRELHSLLTELSFSVEESDVELEKLKNFSAQIKALSYRDKSVFFGTLTKIYMLRADSDNALLTFVEAQINAEISKAYDIEAWLFADIAQVYIDFYTYDLAMECIDTALRYGEGQPMEPFFYEYCYVTLAELNARSGNLEAAEEYYQTSLETDSPDLPEYQSMDLRRHLIMANIALAQKSYQECIGHLEIVGEVVDSLDFLPIDVLWASGIYYPYLELRTKAALGQEDYPNALFYMDNLFAAGTLYGQTGSLMNLLAEIISTFREIDIDTISTQMRTIVENYTQKLVLEYPDAFQQKNMLAGAHIYNSNMTTVAAFVQQNKMEAFYRLVAEGVVLIVIVIASLILVLRKSEQKSRIDGLTGAYNRKFLNKILNDLTAKAQPFGLIMFDIDFFKQINDGYGHEAGDTALRDITALIQRLLNRDSNIFRFGGDEFCIICQRTGLKQIAALAERIREEVEKLVWEEYEGMQATLSMGVAHTASSSDVMAAADERLYHSKEAGRNCVSWEMKKE